MRHTLRFFGGGAQDLSRNCAESGYHNRLNRDAGMSAGKRAARFAALAGMLITLWAATALADDRVKTQSGVVDGVAVASPGVRIFRGIPFAAPPIGALRWKAPQ